MSPDINERIERRPEPRITAADSLLLDRGTSEQEKRREETRKRGIDVEASEGLPPPPRALGGRRGETKRSKEAQRGRVSTLGPRRGGRGRRRVTRNRRREGRRRKAGGATARKRDSDSMCVYESARARVRVTMLATATARGRDGG